MDTSNLNQKQVGSGGTSLEGMLGTGSAVRERGRGMAQEHPTAGPTRRASHGDPYSSSLGVKMVGDFTISNKLLSAVSQS